MRRKKLVVAGVVVALGVVAGAYYAMTYEPGADRGYDTSVAAPVLKEKKPRVLVDHGHRNVHTIRGRYGPFAKLVEADGCRIESTSAPFTEVPLDGADILVVVNARGPEQDSAKPAFSPQECASVRGWVANGGSLLLVADHHPCGEAAAELALQFGVEMSGGWTDDEANARQGSGDPGQLLFTRESGRLGDHAITRGSSQADAINTVETFTGQSLKGPTDSTAILILADSAIDRIPVGSNSETKGSQTFTTFETEDRSAAGRCQGLAMKFGKGRVVVLAEAAMLTAQIDDKSGRKFGMNAPGNDNRAFVLNVVRWLAGVGE